MADVILRLPIHNAGFGADAWIEVKKVTATHVIGVRADGAEVTLDRRGGRVAVWHNGFWWVDAEWQYSDQEPVACEGIEWLRIDCGGSNG